MKTRDSNHGDSSESKRLSMLSVDELTKALEEANDTSEITPIVNELERRSYTDFKEKTQLQSDAKLQEPRDLQPPAQDDPDPPYTFHLVGGGLLFMFGYIFMIIAGFKLLVYWSDDYASKISLVSIAVYAALSILCLGFAHIIAMLIAIAKQHSRP